MGDTHFVAKFTREPTYGYKYTAYAILEIKYEAQPFEVTIPRTNRSFTINDYDIAYRGSFEDCEKYIGDVQ